MLGQAQRHPSRENDHHQAEHQEIGDGDGDKTPLHIMWNRPGHESNPLRRHHSMRHHLPC